MKYSLRKSFSYRRKKDIHDEEHINPRIDTNPCSNLVKSKQSKSFLGRRRRYSSSPPPTSSPPIKTKNKTFDYPYNNHINDDDDDDPFSSSTNDNKRLRPFDKLTFQIRKSFRNTLTRQRPRLESNNSNKRLIFNSNDENRRAIPGEPPISTGLTSPVIYSIESATIPSEIDKTKAPLKRRKAPLAPTHMNHSISLPNQNCLALNISDQQETLCNSTSNDQQENFLTKKSKTNRSLRARISLLLKKRHAKQQQQQQLQNCTEEDPDHQHHDDQDEINNNKKLTFSQRFDTLRRSFHFGNRNSTKGKRYLLANE